MLCKSSATPSPRHWGPRAGTCPDAAQRAYLVHSEIQASPPSSPAHTRTILQIIHIGHVIGLRNPTKPPNENHLLRGSRPSSQFPSVSVACMPSVYASPFRLSPRGQNPTPAPGPQSIRSPHVICICISLSSFRLEVRTLPRTPGPHRKRTFPDHRSRSLPFRPELARPNWRPCPRLPAIPQLPSRSSRSMRPFRVCRQFPV